MGKQRRYTDKFKREVLAMAASGEKSIPAIKRKDLPSSSHSIFPTLIVYQISMLDNKKALLEMRDHSYF